MSQASPNLALPYLQPSQAQKHVTHNEALERLDIIVQLSVAAFGAETPPGVPGEGEVHALGPAPTGDWAGQGNALAAWLDGVWTFLTPQPGWRAWGQGELRVWDGAAWVLPPAERDNLTGLGIGTTSDATNRLAVQADATLLTHDGAGHQVKVNKAGATDTASLLFQSDWTGHAEMGLAGNTDFTIKVSADGTAWSDALTIDAASGLASGTAVQGAADDATAGRLMAVGAFGLGVATGAVGLLADMDATGLASGFYRMDASTLNRPAGPDRGVVTIRRLDAGSFLQVVSFPTGHSTQRYYNGGSFTNWSDQYGSRNIVATVSQSGGTPTGGVIERGSNADGEYVRWADGTQICTNANAPITTAPAAFAGTITRIDGDKLWIGTWF